MKANASDNIQDLTGKGLEFFTDKEGLVRLEFWNGTIVRSNPSGNTEDTALSVDDKAITDMFNNAEPSVTGLSESVSNYIPLGLRTDEEQFDQENVIYIDFKNKKRV